jgi:hypothetical protein
MRATKAGSVVFLPEPKAEGRWIEAVDWLMVDG